MTAGNGKFEKTGLGTDREAKEAVDTAYRYLKANAKSISGSISLTTKDYIMDVQDFFCCSFTLRLISSAKRRISSTLSLSNFPSG